MNFTTDLQDLIKLLRDSGIVKFKNSEVELEFNPLALTSPIIPMTEAERLEHTKVSLQDLLAKEDEDLLWST